MKVSPCRSNGSGEIVRHEAARVARDGRRILADADSGRLAAHDPRADDGMVRPEAAELPVGLPDVALVAVFAGRFHRRAARGDRDVRAFARVERLLHEVGREAPRLEARL